MVCAEQYYFTFTCPMYLIPECAVSESFGFRVVTLIVWVRLFGRDQLINIAAVKYRCRRFEPFHRLPTLDLETCT